MVWSRYLVVEYLDVYECCQIDSAISMACHRGHELVCLSVTKEVERCLSQDVERTSEDSPWDLRPGLDSYFLLRVLLGEHAVSKGPLRGRSFIEVRLVRS